MSYLSFDVVAHVAFVSRRLYQLALEPAASVLGCKSMWRDYPPVTFELKQRSSCMYEKRVVRVNDVRFVFTTLRQRWHIAPLLSLLRHITALRLILDSYTADVPAELFATLQHFQQLQSLVVRYVITAAERPLKLALGGLRSLRSLRLDVGESWASRQVIRPIRQLCTSQLDHLTVTPRQVYDIAGSQLAVVMTRLCSLTVAPGPLIGATARLREAVYMSWLSQQLPSLLHLTVGSN